MQQILRRRQILVQRLGALLGLVRPPPLETRWRHVPQVPPAAILGEAFQEAAHVDQVHLAPPQGFEVGQELADMLRQPRFRRLADLRRRDHPRGFALLVAHQFPQPRLSDLLVGGMQGHVMHPPAGMQAEPPPVAALRGPACRPASASA